jgi:hypothetical protein
VHCGDTEVFNDEENAGTCQPQSPRRSRLPHTGVRMGDFQFAKVDATLEIKAFYGSIWPPD